MLWWWLSDYLPRVLPVLAFIYFLGNISPPTSFFTKFRMFSKDSSSNEPILGHENMLNDATDLSQSIASTLYEEEYSSNQITPSLREFFLASSNNNEYVGTTGQPTTQQQQRMISHDSNLSGSENNSSSANSTNYPMLSPMVLFQKGSSHPMNPLTSPVGNNHNNHNNHFPIKNPSLQGTVTTESSTPHSTRGYSPPSVPH
jgi:hypothetical protein